MKKVLVAMCIILAMVCGMVYAADVGLLSDNPLTENDLTLYTVTGGMDKVVTGATYSWQSGSDSAIVSALSSESKKLSGGHVTSSEADYVGESTSGSSAESTVIYDLKSIYAVNRIDVWHISQAQKQLGKIKVKASLDGAEYTDVDTFTAKTPTIADGDSAKYPVLDICRFDPVNARYISISFSKASAANSYILGDVLIFGNESSIEIEPWVGELAFRNADGDRVYAYPASGKVYANVEAKNVNALLVIAGYDEDGNLIKTSITDAKYSEQGKKYEIKGEFTIDPENKPASIKAMLFNSKTTVTPLTACKVLTDDDISGEGLISSTHAVVDGTKIYRTNPSYEWVTSGENATDSQLAGSTAELFDGDAQTSRSTANSAGTDAYGNIVIHMDGQMEITKVAIRSMCSDSSYVESFDIYASGNDDSYNYIATGVNTNSSKLNRVMQSTCELGNKIYAKDIKIVMNKKLDASNMQIAEVEVYGKPATLGRVRSTSYRYDQDVAYQTSTDITSADYSRTALSNGNLDNTVDALGDYVNLVYDFDDQYQVDTIKVYGQAAGAEILTSPDGMTFRNVGYYECDGGVISASGVPGRNAKFVKIILHKGHLPKISLSEVEVYGRKLFDENAPVNTTVAKVPIYTELKSNNILYVDWTDYDERVNGVTDGYKLFIEKTDFTNASAKNPVSVFENANDNAHAKIEGKYCTYAGLEPDTDYYVAVVPNHAVASQGAVTTTKIHTYDALGSGKLSAVFCINDYPANVAPGGAHIDHPDETANRAIMYKLLNGMEAIHNTRFWFAVPNAFRANGVGYLIENSGNVATHNANGCYTFSIANEPDISSAYKTNYSGFASNLAEAYSNIKAVNSKNLMVAPTICGTDKLSWWENVYKADPTLGSHFDVADVHIYCKRFEGTGHYDDNYTDFESYSVPEHIYGKTSRIRSLLAQYDDASKPLITTEVGWSTHNDDNNAHIAEKVSVDRQADYIARCYLNCIANGYKNVYIYAFQDEGYENTNSEWQYGMVDWYGNPKPAYYTAYTLMKVVKNAEYVGPVDGISHPNYGCSFWDESRNKYITALWTADGKDRVVNISAEERCRVIDAYGNVSTSSVGGTVAIGKSPIYIISDEALTIG